MATAPDPPTSKKGIKTFFNKKQAPAAIILLGILLVLPSINSGLITDDYIHNLILSGNKKIPGLTQNKLDLFTFSSGQPEQLKKMMDLGVFSWWTAGDFKLSFFRPISSLTHMVDFYFFDNASPFRHLHSIFWLLCLLLVVARLFQRFHYPMVASLALLLYSIDDAHGFTVGFVANRNAIIAAVFSLLSLLIYDRFVREKWIPGKYLSPLLLGLALFSGEIALSIGGYYFSYNLFIDKRPLKNKLRSLLPHFITTSAWIITYNLLGFGTRSTGLYINPVSEPLLFVKHLIMRLPILLTGQFGFPPSDFWIFYPGHLLPIIYGLAILFIFLLIVVIFPIIKQSTTLRFWGLGVILASVPVCGTFPSDRNLLFVGIGAMGILAEFFASFFSGKKVYSYPGKLFIILLVIFHFFLAPLLLPFRSGITRDLMRIYNRIDQTVPAAEEITQKTVVIVNAPSDGTVCYIPFIRNATGVNSPKHIRLLATSFETVTVTRIDNTTIRLQPKEGFLKSLLQRMVRSDKKHFQAGEKIEIKGMTATIITVTTDGRPLTVDFNFAVPLEESSFLWYTWQEGDLVPFVLPQKGENLELPPITFL